MSPDLVPSVEAARILGIDRSTLTRLVQFGTLTPAMRLPGQTGAMLFHRADLERLRDVRDQNRAEPKGAA